MIQTEMLEALKQTVLKSTKMCFFILPDQLNRIKRDWIYAFYGFSFFLMNFK